MHVDDIKSRLHDALHRGHSKATEQELAEVTAVVIAIVAEVATELATVIGSLAERVSRLEEAS